MGAFFPRQPPEPSHEVRRAPPPPQPLPARRSFPPLLPLRRSRARRFLLRNALRDGFRLGADDLAEFGEIGGHTVGYREVKRTGSKSLGDLVNDGARQFFAILAHQHSGQFNFSAGPDFAPSHGNAIDLKLLLGVEGFDIEGDLLYLQRVESAL